MIHRSFIPKVVIGLVIGVTFMCMMPAWYAPATVSAQEIAIDQKYFLSMTEYSPDKGEVAYLNGHCMTTEIDPNIVIECNDVLRVTTPGSNWKVTFTLQPTSRLTGGLAIQDNITLLSGVSRRLTGLWTLWQQAAGISSILISQTELGPSSDPNNTITLGGPIWISKLEEQP